MIIFLTTAAFSGALKGLAGTGFGCPLPEIKLMSYEYALRQKQIPVATYVFSDLERLHGFEMHIASALYGAVTRAGLRALNNPARVKLRYELLRELAALGLNPFNVYRADDRPRPSRFPVFLRIEGGHVIPQPRLLRNQPELDAAIEAFKDMGHPTAGLLVVECHPSDRIEGRWFKWGSFGVGGEAVLEHIAVDDTWLVKTGRWEQLTPGIVELEHQAVQENRHASYVAEIFRIAGIGFGRADFAFSGGRPVFFEINTNPRIDDLVPDPHLLRNKTREKARQNLAAALFNIDTKGGGLADVPESPALIYCRSHPPGTLLAPRQ